MIEKWIAAFENISNVKNGVGLDRVFFGATL